MSKNPDIFKQLGKSVIEAGVPFGGLAISIWELIENNIDPEQAEAATNWIVAANKESLRLSPRDKKINEISNFLRKEVYNKTPQERKSGSPGTPSSILVNDH